MSGAHHDGTPGMSEETSDDTTAEVADLKARIAQLEGELSAVQVEVEQWVREVADPLNARIAELEGDLKFARSEKATAELPPASVTPPVDIQSCEAVHNAFYKCAVRGRCDRLDRLKEDGACK